MGKRADACLKKEPDQLLMAGLCIILTLITSLDFVITKGNW